MNDQNTMKRTFSRMVIQGHKYDDLKNIMEASDMNIRKGLYRNSNSKK